MIDSDLPVQIARLEGEIEHLADRLETCRKVMVFSKVAIGAGAIWVLAYILGAVGFHPSSMIAAIGAVIGGVVLLGSNSTTAKLTTTAMKDAETQRAELIDRIDARAVGGIRLIPDL
jgi:hypothetical protein